MTNMTDPFSSMLAMQKQLLDAQRASLGAMHKGVGLGDGLLAFQEAGQRAVEANIAAWQAWGRLWGMR